MKQFKVIRDKQQPAFELKIFEVLKQKKCGYVLGMPMLCSPEENVSLSPLCSFTFSQCPSYQEKECGLSSVPLSQDYFDYDRS